MRSCLNYQYHNNVLIRKYTHLYLLNSTELRIFAPLNFKTYKTMTKVISILNFKGGVAKSTTTYNLGVALWTLGKRVLLIDTDSQCNLSGLIGFNQTEGDSTFYEWMHNDEQPMPVYEQYPGLFYVPASSQLSDIESFLMNKRNREKVLAKKMQPYMQPMENGLFRFDYVLIDCAPKDGIVNDNAMSASDYVLIPTECSGFSLQGMQNLLFSINDVKENLNEKLDILGFLIVKYDKQTRISKKVTEYFESNYQAKVFSTKIRRNVKFDETPLANQGIFEYSPEANGAEDYMCLAEEITSMKRPDNWQSRALNAWQEANSETDELIDKKDGKE